ncbi:hypothetical protein Vretimale_14015, partial [Volvox reticuliferus]
RSSHTYCPPVAGYSVKADTVIQGYDIGSYVADGASACNKYSNCTSFAWVSPWVEEPNFYDKVNTGWPKYVISPTTYYKGICLYIKMPSGFDFCSSDPCGGASCVNLRTTWSCGACPSPTFFTTTTIAGVTGPACMNERPPPVNCITTQFNTVGTCHNLPPAQYYFAYGQTDVTYTLAYTYADGTRSPPSTMSLGAVSYTYVSPHVYFEFASNISTLLQAVGPSGKRRTGIVLQRSGSINLTDFPAYGKSNFDGLSVDVVHIDTGVLPMYCYPYAGNGVNCLDRMQPPHLISVSGWRWPNNGTSGSTPLYPSLGEQVPPLVFNSPGGMRSKYYIIYEFYTNNGTGGQRSYPFSNLNLAVSFSNPSQSQPTVYVEFLQPVLLLSQSDAIIIQRVDQSVQSVIDVARIPGSVVNNTRWLTFMDRTPFPTV